MKKQNCIYCGDLAETDICECCLFVKNHPEVIMDDIHYSWVILEAIEQAAERALFKKTEQNLKKSIDKLNGKLKRNRFQ